MPAVDGIDAWTGIRVRAVLTEPELVQVPVHPAGDLEEELSQLLPENTG